MPASQPGGRRESARVGGLEDEDVDILLREDVAMLLGRKHRLVAEALDHVPEQRPDLGMGLADEDPHRLTIGCERADSGGIWYGSGMRTRFEMTPSRQLRTSS